MIFPILNLNQKLPNLPILTLKGDRTDGNESGKINVGIDGVRHLPFCQDYKLIPWNIVVGLQRVNNTAKAQTIDLYLKINLLPCLTFVL